MTVYELEAHESELLLAACRTADQLAGLATIIAVEGLLESSPQGLKAHPAVVEHRQLSMTLARLLAALRLPAGLDEGMGAGDRRPQRRMGARGPQRLGGVA